MDRRLIATLNNVGVCLYRLGRYGDAIQTYQRAIQAAMAVCEGGVGLETSDLHRDLELAESQYGTLRIELSEQDELIVLGLAFEPLDLYELDVSAVQASMVPKPIRVPLRESADPSLRYLPSDLDCRNSAITIYNMALVHIQNENIVVAEKLVDMALDAVRAATFPDVAAMILNCSALVKNALGNGEDAIDSLFTAMDLGRQLINRNLTSGETEDDGTCKIDAKECYALTLALMGRVCYQNGDYERALVSCNNLLQSRRHNLGEDHIQIVASMYNCGLVLYELGNMDDAIENCNPLVVRIENWRRQELQQVDTRQIATALHNVGVMYVRNNRVMRSVELLTKALDAFVSASGDDHIDAATTNIELGKLKQDMGLYTEAIMHYSNALRIHKKDLGGVDSIDVALIQCHMGLLHYSRGELDEAMVVFEEIIHIICTPTASGDQEALAIKVQETMGNILLEKGELEQAMAKFTDAARTLASSTENDHGPADPPGSLVVLPNFLQSMGVRMFPAAAAA